VFFEWEGRLRFRATSLTLVPWVTACSSYLVQRVSLATVPGRVVRYGTPTSKGGYVTVETGAKEERLDWDEAQMHPKTVSGFILVIRGRAPVPMTVRLRALPIGVAPVDYQGVEVLGIPQGDVTPQVETPWGLQVDPGDLPTGRKGFVLVAKRAYFPPREE
jgi:hypothetical protein